MLTRPAQNEACYSADATTSSAMVERNATLDVLLSDFVVGVHVELEKQGKTAVVWEEVRRPLSCMTLAPR